MRASADLYERTAAEPALALQRDQLSALPIPVAVFNTYGEAHDNMHTPQVAAMPPPSWPQPQPQPRLAAAGHTVDMQRADPSPVGAVYFGACRWRTQLPRPSAMRRDVSCPLIRVCLAPH